MKKVFTILTFVLFFNCFLKGQVYISEIMYDSPGFDDEWVEITNDGAADVDISGYKLTDSDGSTVLFTFPSVTTLLQGSSIVIAVGDDGDEDLFNDGNTSFPLTTFTPDFVIDGVVIGGPTTSNEFGNSSGTVALLDAAMNTVSTVNYTMGGSPNGDGNGNTFSYDSGGNPTVGSASPTLGGFTLPVDFTKIETKVHGKQISLNWQTATEINNERFDIQKSNDGKTFETIGSVKGEGNSTRVNDYTYTDVTPNSGVNYYRLKQIDFDGRFDYSEVVSATVKSEKIVVAPSRTEDVFSVFINNDEQASIYVYNMAGQLITSKGNVSGTQEINLGSMIQGTYLVTITANSQTQVEKVVKL